MYEPLPVGKDSGRETQIAKRGPGAERTHDLWLNSPGPLQERFPRKGSSIYIHSVDLNNMW